MRAWHLESRRCPRVDLKDLSSIRALTYNCTKVDMAKRSMTIHAMPQHSTAIMEWLKLLPIKIKYTGQGLPNIAAQVLLLLVKHCRIRQYLSGEEKAALLEQYNLSCAACGAKNTDMEWDHVQALQGLAPGAKQEFQPLCSACHQLETSQEPRSMTRDFMASHFEKSVYENYAMSPRPPSMVYKLKDCEEIQGCQISDVIRCRKRALEFNAHPIPIFSPLDYIEPITNFTLGDINFVSKAPRSNSSCLELCYTQGWTHRCLTEFLLHHGIISWQHVTHKLVASAHYPPNTFEEPLYMMDEAWKEVGYPELAKQCINSFIGLWAVDENYDYRCLSSGHEQDAPKDALKSTFHYKNGLIHDFITKEKLDSGGVSNRPLHHLATCLEHMRIGCMLYALRRSRCIVYELKTDYCLYRKPKH